MKILNEIICRIKGHKWEKIDNPNYGNGAVMCERCMHVPKKYWDNLNKNLKKMKYLNNKGITTI